METMVAVAIALWFSVGSFLAPHITVVAADPIPAYANVDPGYGWTDGNGTPDCVIYILHRYFDRLTPALQQDVISHEYGHCIGLMHISQPGLMAASPMFSFAAADRAEFYRVHPLPVRGRAASIASE